MQNLKDIPCLILGIGNILWADEGFGVRVVEAFNDKYAFTDPNNVIADGGTLGMYLYDRICRAEKAPDFLTAATSKANPANSVSFATTMSNFGLLPRFLRIRPA